MLRHAVILYERDYTWFTDSLVMCLLQSLSKTLTGDELFYLKEQFALFEPSKNGTIGFENIKMVGLTFR